MSKYFHYTACGLDNVWLANGFKFKSTRHGNAVAVRDVEGLHQLIAITLIDKPGRLTGKEFRFLRTQLGLSQEALATMLGFIATDAAVPQELLQSLVREAADESFNRITIDGDTSTNDCFMLIASRRAAHAEITSLDSADAQTLRTALISLAQELAQAIVRDVEGATKFITVQVDGGRSREECRQVAYAIAHSPLVKTAFFASDPNLGRILAAIGYAGVSDLDVSKLDLYLDDVWVARSGGRHPDYHEQDGQRVMKQSEITVRVLLGRGQAEDTVWTCDLSHDYVTINADYRS